MPNIFPSTSIGDAIQAGVQQGTNATMPDYSSEFSLSPKQSASESEQIKTAKANYKPVEHKDLSIGDRIALGVDAINSTVEAQGQAVATGAARIASTVAKAINDMTKNSGLDKYNLSIPENKYDPQKFYERMQKQEDKNSETNPGLFLGDAVGNIAASTIVMGPLLGMGAKAYSAVGGGIKGLLASVPVGAVEGGIYGGMQNRPGQEGVVNVPGAFVGGVTGAILSPIAGFVGSKYQDYLNHQTALKNADIEVNGTPVKYEGELVNNKDDAGGILHTLRSKLVGTVNLIPGVHVTEVSNITKNAEAEGSGPAAQYVNDYQSALARNTEGMDEQAIKSQILKTNKTMLAEAERARTEFWTAADSAGITRIPVTNTQEVVPGLLKDPKGLSQTTLDKLNTNISAVSPRDLMSFKQDVGKELATAKEAFSKSGNAEAGIASSKLSSLYGALSDDFRDATAGTAAAQPFEDMNAMTSAQKDFSSKVANPDIAPVIKKVNDQMQATKKLINTALENNPLTGQGATKQQVQNILGAVGEPGADALERIKMSRIVADNIDSYGRLNVSGYLDATNPAKNPNLNMTAPKSLEFLKGLRSILLQQNNAEPLAMIGMEELGKIMDKPMMMNTLDNIGRNAGMNMDTMGFFINRFMKQAQKFGISLETSNLAKIGDANQQQTAPDYSNEFKLK